MTDVAELIAGLTDGQRAQLCPTCVDATQTTRYCARFACVCGHEMCPAFQFYVPRKVRIDVPYFTPPSLALVPVEAP